MMEFISTVEKASSHTREIGDFVVIYKGGGIKFSNLINAFIFYFRLNSEASLWDITEGDDLLEKKCFSDAT